MTNQRFTLLTVAALALGAALASGQQATPVPSALEVPERVKDFGSVPQGEVVSHAFKLVNTGSQPLTVKGVRPTCGCTVAEFDREIAPGKEGFVRARLDTTGFSGPITKSILVITDDSASPTVSVIMKADVQPYLEALPRPLLRFNAIQGEPAVQKVTITSEQPDSFSVTGFDSNVPFITATSRKLEERELLPGKSKDQYEVTLSLAADAPTGPISATVTVLTDHPKAKKVTLKIYGVVRALLYATPGELQFGPVEARLQPSRSVMVVNNQAAVAAEITSAEVSDPAFEVKVAEIDKGRRYEIVVSVKADAAAGSRDTALTVTTSDPAHPRLVVPVRASIQ